MSDPSATVALHGQSLFEERRAFYRAIDGLFAGGAALTEILLAP